MPRTNSVIVLKYNGQSTRSRANHTRLISLRLRCTDLAKWLTIDPLQEWYKFVRNDDVRRLRKQPKLTTIIQSRRLTLFGHVICIDDNAEASPPADWRRQPGHPHIWLRTVLEDLKQHRLLLPEAADLVKTVLCGG